MAHVTIENTPSYVRYNVTTSDDGPFTVSFAIFDEADLTVEVDGESIGSAFSFTPTGSATGGYQAGTVTLDVAVANAEVLIYRNITPSRTSDYGVGPLPKDAVNSEFDRVQAQIADLRRDVGVSLRVALGSTIGDLPVAADRSLKWIRFDIDGEPEVSDAPEAAIIDFDGMTLSEETFTGDGTETEFTVGPMVVGSKYGTILIVGGVVQPVSAYEVEQDGSSVVVTLDEAPEAGVVCWLRTHVAQGQQGNIGVTGASTAQVALYQRSASAPSQPVIGDGSATYTFATGVLTSAPAGWTQAVPATDGNPLYAIYATASSNTATDTIAYTEWSTAVKVAQDGAAGTSRLPFTKISGPTNAVAENHYGADSLTAARTITLPTPPAGRIIVSDVDGNAAVNNVTIARNGNTIAGSATDYIINVNRGWVELDGASGDWRIVRGG